jgi:ADP-heptose:LPS heptosyltransferase
MGIDPAEMEPVPRMDLNATQRLVMEDRLRTIGKRVLGVQAGSGPVTRWPPRPDVKGLSAKQWAAFMEVLLDTGDADAIVLQGSGRERAIAESVIRATSARFRSRIHDWTGRFSLDELLHVMSGYRALLSVDTGPAHMAASVGCPVLAVFGPTDPCAYRMRGSSPVEVVLGKASCQFCGGTDRFKRCRENRCLSDLPLSALLDGWNALRARL